MGKASLCCIPLVLFCILLPSFLKNTAFATDKINFSFSNQSSFVDESKILHVFGEVKNDSTTPVQRMVITAEFFDKDGASIAKYNASAALRQINPHASSPFEVEFLDYQKSALVKNFTLAASGIPSSGEEEKMKIMSVNSRLDLLGTFYVNVVASNNGQQPANNSLAIATLYDAHNRVIALGTALAEASPGSSDVPPGATAPFGIAVTEKLQTYKATHYSVIIESDQYVSDRISVNISGGNYASPGSGNPAPVSRCLIATAAYGSDFAPQVQELRTFRDQVALRTFSGTSFMQVFNEWYYSFSPQVAAYERVSPWLQDAVRFSIQPLLAILATSKSTDNVVFASTSNSEFAILIAGIEAGFLLGGVYLGPLAAGISFVSPRRLTIHSSRGLKLLGAIFGIGLVAVVIGLSVSSEGFAMAGTGVIVLSSLGSAVVAVIWGFSNLKALYLRSP